MSKLFISCGRFYKKNEAGNWVFWCNDHWEPSKDASPSSMYYEAWLLGLTFIGNNFRLK